MNETLIFTIAILVGLGIVAALVLYIIAQKFKVYEDPRIDQVEEMLPSANCGGCGFAGCRAMATALVEQEDISALYCPPGGQETMSKIAGFLGKSAGEKEPLVAVVRCNGQTCNRTKTNIFDGADSCAVIAATYGGETGCTWGCLGKGDCTLVCTFDAIHMNPETGLPEVDEEKCTACGACVKACPKIIIELRKKGPKGRRVFVSCINKDKGAVAMKSCKVACIGCGKCVKACPFEAITLENNLAYIDPMKCRICRKCVPECPTKAIWEVNFPPRAEVKPPLEKGKPTEAAAPVTPAASAAAPETAQATPAAPTETVKTAKTEEPAKAEGGENHA